ncbi:glycoside hydrolase superfamily [Chytridium lagenaria]|nr:glycoside hydrolase superfamily [Chytridium lagenaria]
MILLLLLSLQAPCITSQSITSATQTVSIIQLPTTTLNRPISTFTSLGSSPAKPILHGIYDYQDADFNQSTYNLQVLQTFQDNRRFGVIQFFTQWCQAVANKPYYDTIVFKEKLPSIWDEMKAVPLITWQPACFDPDSTTGDGFIKDVVDGKYNAFVDSWAGKLLDFVKGPDGVSGTPDDRRVYLRLAHEMNTVFYPWCPGKNSAITDKDYINFWRFTRSRFDKLGFLKSQLQWMWCPNNFDSGSVTAERLYPGNDAVDWVCFDGYNGAGIFNDNAGWADPLPLMDPIVGRLNALTGGKKPMAVAEFGTVLKLPEPGIAGKGKWIKDFYALAAKRWNLSLTAYFNQDVWAVKGYKQPDLEAWREVVIDKELGLVSGNDTNPRLITDEVFWGRWAGDGVTKADGGTGQLLTLS